MDIQRVAAILLVLTLAFSIAAADDYTQDVRILRDTGISTGNSGISVMGIVYTDEEISASDLRIRIYNSDMDLIETLNPGLFIELSNDDSYHRHSFGIFTELSQTEDYTIKVYLNGDIIDTEHYYGKGYDDTDNGAVYNDYYASQEAYSANVEIKDISFDDTLFAGEPASGYVLIKNYGSTTAKFKFEYTYAGETFQNAEYVYIPANSEKRMEIFVDVPQENFVIAAKIYSSAYDMYSEMFGVAYRYKHFSISAPQSADIFQGNSTKLSIDIKNDGYEADDYKVSASGWEKYTVEPNVISLAAGRSKKIDLTLATSRDDPVDTYPTRVVVCNSENKCKQVEVAVSVRAGSYSGSPATNEITNTDINDAGITGHAISSVGEVYKNWPYMLILTALAIGVYIALRKKFAPAVQQDEAVKIEPATPNNSTIEIDPAVLSDTETTIPVEIREMDNTEPETK